MNKYRVREVKAKSGERIPLLIDDAGMPVFEATLHTLTVGRARNQAYNSIANALRSISIFLSFIEYQNIALSQRIMAGDLFDINEIQELVVFSRFSLKHISALEKPIKIKTTKAAKPNIESNRCRTIAAPENVVVPAFSATRVRYIRDYVVWFVRYQSTFFKWNHLVKERLERNLSIFISAIDARIPMHDRRGIINGRQGLSEDAIAHLIKIVNPASNNNPWKSEHSRHRNNLLISWLVYLGIRRGEALGVKISDIDFKSGEVTILRRADDPDEMRNNPPNAKTRARTVPLSDELMALTRQYVTLYRSMIHGANSHEFLFVSDQGGMPMSISSFSKVFAVLRAKSSGLPDQLFAHLFRHTWNDRFSEQMDKNGIGE